MISVKYDRMGNPFYTLFLNFCTHNHYLTSLSLENFIKKFRHRKVFVLFLPEDPYGYTVCVHLYPFIDSCRYKYLH